jgi:hypothetical protein
MIIPLDVKIALERNIWKDPEWLNNVIEKSGFIYKNPLEYESLCRLIVCKANYTMKKTLLVLRLVKMSDSQYYPYDILNAKRPEGHVPTPEVFFDIWSTLEWCNQKGIRIELGETHYRVCGYRLYVDCDYTRYF